MKLLNVVIGVISMMVFSKGFASCESDWIKDRSLNGSVITFSSGDIYEISSFDTMHTRLWLPTEEVLICDNGFLIKKEDGEKVSAEKIN